MKLVNRPQKVAATSTPFPNSLSPFDIFPEHSDNKLVVTEVLDSKVFAVYMSS